MVHVGDLRCVPSGDILIKTGRTSEHAADGCDPAGVPSGDVLIKTARVSEHTTHIGDLRCVPGRDVSIESTG